MTNKWINKKSAMESIEAMVKEWKGKGIIIKSVKTKNEFVTENGIIKSTGNFKIEIEALDESLAGTKIKSNDVAEIKYNLYPNETEAAITLKMIDKNILNEVKNNV